MSMAAKYYCGKNMHRIKSSYVGMYECLEYAQRICPSKSYGVTTMVDMTLLSSLLTWPCDTVVSHDSDERHTVT